MTTTQTARVRLSHRTRVNAIRAATVAIVIALWLWATGSGAASPVILPKIQDVGAEFLSFIASAEVYSALWVTFVELIVAFVIAVVAGFAVAFWAARTKLRGQVVEPLLIWGYLVPQVLFYPIIILWFGIGMPSKLAYAASSAFFPIALNCLRAFRGVDPNFIAVGRAYGASPRQLDWQIKFRASVPLAAAGLRIGAALTMVTVIVAEMLSSTNGLGYLLQHYAQSFNTARSYAIILVVLVVVSGFHFAVRRLLPSDDRT